MPTFADLRAERFKLAREGKFSPEAANDRTALARFMEAHGLNDQSPLIPTMAVESHFKAMVTAFEREVTSGKGGGKKLSPATVTGYRSRLGTWHEVAALLAAKFELPGSFPEAAREAINAYFARHEGQTIASLARQMDVYPTVLWHWYNEPGHTPRPNAKGMARVAKLEALVGLPPGTLATKMVTRRTRSASRGKGDRPMPELRPEERLYSIQLMPEVLPESITSFFAKLDAFKTSMAPMRNAGGVRLKRNGTKWRAAADGGESESGRIVRRWLTSMVGWLTLPETQHEAREVIRERCTWPGLTEEAMDTMAPLFVGRGMVLEEVTLCHLLDPDLIGPFLDWKTKRSGTESGFHRAYLSHASALLHPGRGFLAQQVEHAWDYAKLGIQPIGSNPPDPEEYRSRSAAWETICIDWNDAIRELRKTVGNKSKARDPATNLKPLLDHPSPVSVVIDMIRSHEASKPLGELEPGYPGASRLAVWWRDQLLLRMLVTNPLRNRNFRQMTWRNDGRGNLYKDAQTGGWRLRFDPSDFKNERGAAHRPYDVEIPSHITPFIETYLFEARPIILRGKERTDVVFLNRYGKPFPLAGLSALLWDLTGGNLDPAIEMSGFRSHAFRHIVATAWLRDNPGDYLTVARMLHDDLHTVLANYEHSSPDHGLKRYAEWLRPMLTAA